MKLAILRKLLLPVGLLVLGTAAAYADPVACSSVMTLQDAINANSSGGCLQSNFLFSNFSFDFGSTPANLPAPVASDVALTISDDGFSDYFLVADFTSSNPLFAVMANQTLTFQLQYLVTEENPNDVINYIDGLGQMGIQPNVGSTASGQLTTNACLSGAYSGASPTNNCPGASQNVDMGLWNQNQAAGDPTNVNNQSQQGGGTPGSYVATGDPVSPLNANNLTSVGIYDNATIYGGTINNPAGQPQAVVGIVENDFNDAPEPATFILVGGALLAFGAIRRKKIA